jgi:hypothetical protein
VAVELSTAVLSAIDDRKRWKNRQLESCEAFVSFSL